MATRPAMPTPSSDVRNEVRKIEQTFESAFNSKNVETITNLYEQDAVFTPPNQPACQGKDQIRKFFQAFIEGGGSDLHLETNKIESSGDLIAHCGRYRGNVPKPGGGTKADRGNYICVYRRQPNGDLRAVLDTFNSENPA